MKKFIQTILLLSICLGLKAQSPLLEQANQHYVAGKYEQAIESYNQILNNNQESAEVYYNLGNAYYKTNQFTLAILNYERAKLLAPNDEDIQFNLEMANQHVVDAINPLPQVFFIRWWNNLTNKLSVDGWARTSVVSFILFLVLAGLFFFTPNGLIKRLSFWCGLLVIVISIFSFNFAARHKKRITEHNFAIITQTSVTVKSSPADNGTDLFMIHEGLKVEIKDNLGQWLQIRLSDGNQGWLPSDSLERI